MSETLADLRWVDVFDILIVTALCWIVIAWMREARARIALGGMASIALLFGLARWLELNLTTSFLQGFIALAALVLVVVFQDDLRRFLEGITLWAVGSATPRPSDDVLDELGSLCFALAARRTGALFVLPGRESIDRLLDGGYYLDGRVSEPLLWSLLDPGTPGHDGAIVIRAGRVSRFGVHLPLSTEWAEIGGGGTRHAAGLGLTERSDALSIIVSEERGEVSLASRGRLEQIPDAAILRERLDRFLRRTARQRHEPWLGSRVLKAARRRWREGILAAGLALGFWIHTASGAELAPRPAHELVCEVGDCEMGDCEVGDCEVGDAQRRDRRCSRPSMPRSVSHVSPRSAKAMTMLISSK